MNIEEVQKFVPGIKIDEKNQLLIDGNGWWKNQVAETNTESIARVKEVVKEFKEMHRTN
jgi:hypothetical protein